MSVSSTKERSSGIPGAIGHALFTNPFPRNKSAAPLTHLERSAGVAAAGTMAVVDTFLAIKNGLDGDASTGKKVVSALTAAAGAGFTVAAAARNPLFIPAGIAAFAGGIFRDLME